MTESLDKSYLEHSRSTSFGESYNKLNNLQTKPTYEENRNVERRTIKKAHKEIEDKNYQNCTNRLYGPNFSGNEWNRHRMKTSFISVPDAIKLSSENKEKVASGKKKKKNHIGHESSYTINKEELLAEVAKLSEETKPNWTTLGKPYIKRKITDETPGNVGQVAKTLILEWDAKGEIVVNFKDKGVERNIVRRSKHKGKHRVSKPVEPEYKKVKAKMEEEVNSGKVEIGERVVNIQYSKYFIDKDGQPKTKIISVEGRKHPLSFHLAEQIMG